MYSIVRKVIEIVPPLGVDVLQLLGAGAAGATVAPAHAGAHLDGSSQVTRNGHHTVGRKVTENYREILHFLCFLATRGSVLDERTEQLLCCTRLDPDTCVGVTGLDGGGAGPLSRGWTGLTSNTANR